MNILIVSYKSPDHPQKGSFETALFEHAKAWCKNGHTVVWFSALFGEKDYHDVREGVVFIHRGGNILNFVMESIFWYFFGKHPNFDLVVKKFSKYLSFILAFLGSRKLVVADNDSYWWTTNFIFRRLHKIFFKKIIFIASTERLKKVITKGGIAAKNIHVIPKGIAIKPRSMQIKTPKKPVAMYISSTGEQDHLVHAVNAFTEIQRRDMNWNFWIVNYGKFNIGFVRNLLRDSDLGKNTKVINNKGNQGQLELLKKANVLIITGAGEDTENLLNEAICIGIPVVAYKNIFDKFTDLYGEGVENGDYRALGFNAHQLITQQARYDKYLKNRAKALKYLSWDDKTAKSLELIESM